MSPWVLALIAIAGFALEAAVILVGVGTIKGSLTASLAGTNQRIVDMNDNLSRGIQGVKEDVKELGSRVSDAETEISYMKGQMAGHREAAAQTALLKVRPSSGSSHQ